MCILFVFTCACGHCEFKYVHLYRCVCVCFFSSILSCVFFLGVSKGTGAVVIECAFAVFFFLFVCFLPIKQQRCRLFGLWTQFTEHCTAFTVKISTRKVHLRAFS